MPRHKFCKVALAALVTAVTVVFITKAISPNVRKRSPENRTKPSDHKTVKGALRIVNAPKLINNLAEPRALANFLLEPTAMLTNDTNSPKVCWTAVNFLKSAAANVDRRKAVRETWGSMKYRGCGRIWTVFIVGTTAQESVQESLVEEHKNFNDILQLDKPDIKEYVPVKTLAGMQWASATLPREWLYSSADDDIALHVPNFASYINAMVASRAEADPFDEKITAKLPIMCIYSYSANDPPARRRSSKWYMPVEKYPLNHWPPYCRGGWYTIPVAIVSKLHEIIRWMPYLQLDDVWITGLGRIKLLASSNILSDNVILNAMIVSAPLARRKDTELRRNMGEDDISKVIVSHFWANIVGRNVDVCQRLRDQWKLWSKSFS